MKASVINLAIILLVFTKPSMAIVDPLSLEMIEARIKPVGQVTITSPTLSTPSTTQTTALSLAEIGKKIYQSKCMVCHESGLAGAPKLGDITAWQPRIAKGMDTLFQHVKNGFNIMPPKGTCVECSDTDLQAVINYMVANSTPQKK